MRPQKSDYENQNNGPKGTLADQPIRNAMANGTVKFFNAKKGFGFITPDEGDKEIFLTATSLASAGIASLMAGQRVSFETKSEDKGPKAVNLTLIVNPHPVIATPRPPVPQYAQKTAPAEKESRLTIYHDPDSEKSCEALAGLRAAGYEPRVIEYLTTPLTREELITLSMLLRDSNQSLVRKYDPLFLELRLDDRFISENEFWGAIVENPALINGPVIATAQKASVCRSEQALNLFLNAISPNSPPIAPRPKSAPTLQRVQDDAATRPTADKDVSQKAEHQPVQKQPAQNAETKTKTVAEKESKPAAKSQVKPKAKVKAKVAADAKKPEKKPVKKAQRTAK
jgi:arsenate reductase (glutaredoxin)